MMKGFRKLTSRRSLPSSSSSSSSKSSSSKSSSSSITTSNSSMNMNTNTNTNTNVDNTSGNGNIVIKKRSNETLEEAYFRLKNDEFQKAKMAKAKAEASIPTLTSISTSTPIPSISSASNNANSNSNNNNKTKQKNSKRNKKNKRSNMFAPRSMDVEDKEDHLPSTKHVSPSRVSKKSASTTDTAAVTTSTNEMTKTNGNNDADVHADMDVDLDVDKSSTAQTPQQGKCQQYIEQDQDQDEQQNGNGNQHNSSTPTKKNNYVKLEDEEGNDDDDDDTNDNNKIDVQTSATSSSHKHKPQKGPRRAMSKDSVKKDESKLKKILIRLISGILMVGVFVSCMFCGHIYICTLIVFTDIILFRELVKVRYNTFFHIIEETIPLFRTTQWMWFVTAIFYTYSDFVVDVIKSNTSTHYLLDSYGISQCATMFSFSLYSTTFVVSIATMHKDHIRFQVNQLCWTILVLCLTVGQMKYIMHNVYNGLIWFALPIMLVVFNDSFAWLGGVTCGRKFINRELMALSPNKTWEGFFVGWIGTMVAGWHLSRYMAQFTWMTCPTNSFSLFPESLTCELDPVFQEAKHIFPSQIFEVLPRPIVHLIPGVVDICMSTEGFNGDGVMMMDGVSGDAAATLTACVSGNEHHTHHHFELVLRNFYPVQIHALGLGLFASFVAPFGGFLASAIKRAYGLKDFASFIPGHGGMMDRMDCQFLMALCTWVHYNTFVKMATVSLPNMIYMYNNLNDAEQKEFLRRITEGQ